MLKKREQDAEREGSIDMKKAHCGSPFPLVPVAVIIILLLSVI